MNIFKRGTISDPKNPIKKMLLSAGYFISFLLTVIGINSCYHYPPRKSAAPKKESVILVHGVFRTVLAMRPMAKHLSKEGYNVYAIRYLSTRKTIDEHTEDFEKKIESLDIPNDHRIHFVTHSLGGIIVRNYLLKNPDDPRFQRIVMVAPPHKGSETADKYSKVPFSGIICVPLSELRTGSESTVNQMGSPASDYEIGIIAGGKMDSEGYNSDIAGDNDGKVGEYSTHLTGEKDHITLSYPHYKLIRSKRTAEETSHFLQAGFFSEDDNSGRSSSQSEDSNRKGK